MADCMQFFVGKPSEWMSKFLDSLVFKNRIRTKFWFSTRPYIVHL